LILIVPLHKQELHASPTHLTYTPFCFYLEQRGALQNLDKAKALSDTGEW
jgi:hypothetical protein